MIKLLLISVLLIVLNLTFSWFALRTWRNYTEKFYLYNKLTTENLLLLRDIEHEINYEKLLRYAKKKGFKDVSPQDVKGFLRIYQPSARSE
ncbi:MAG: hypothetical protein GXO04_03050 [Aquificae bacterium]|nr:hypothetical protein [Aquificota bacterium]